MSAGPKVAGLKIATEKVHDLLDEASPKGTIARSGHKSDRKMSGTPFGFNTNNQLTKDDAKEGNHSDDER